MVDIAIGMQDERAQLIRVLVLGFAADPMARWASPGTLYYLDRREEFFDAFGGAAFDHGSAFVADGGAAVALWLPPGVTPDSERMTAIFTAQTPPERMEELDELFAKMEAFHPREPHWYLPLIAADPARQGQGLGGALMAAALERVDADGLPAYLESSNPRNLPFYRRFGFKQIGEIRTATSPVNTPMLRPARA